MGFEPAHVEKAITKSLGPKVLAALAHEQHAITVDALKRHFPETSRHHLMLILRDLEIRGQVIERRRKAERFFGLKGFQVGTKPRYPDSSTAIFRQKPKSEVKSWWVNCPDFSAAHKARYGA